MTIYSQDSDRRSRRGERSGDGMGWGESFENGAGEKGLSGLGSHFDKSQL